MPILRLPSTIPGLKSASATVRRWLKKPGEQFAKGDLLVELELEDSLLQLEAPGAGALVRVLVEVSKTVSLGAELAEISAGEFAVPQKSVAVMPNPTPTGKVTPILMPQAGNTMEEGRIVQWKVKVGDRVTVGQVLLEVETDKATVEVESADAGRVAAIVAKEGDVIPVKQAMAYLAENDADVAAFVGSPAPVESKPVAATVAPPPAGSVTPILMPQAGNTMEEGTIIKWTVNVGDRIKVGQVIYEIDTDKASVEVEATEAGRLSRIVAAAGAVVPVKQPVGFLAENDADVDAYIAASGGAAPASAPVQIASTVARASVAAAATAVQTSTGRVKASPAARKIAGETNVDLASVGAGSGPSGRILSTDLGRATAAKPAAAPSASSGGIRKPMSKMRRAIALNLQTSKQTVPHFYLKMTIDADPLFAFYKAQKPATGCTLNDVILLALGKTIAEFPGSRSRIDGNDIVEFPNANIGVAVSVDEGLVVPVIMAIEKHTLATLPAETKRVVEAARKGKLENIGKGVFTISNMGMLGVEEFAAIINPPESGILAISAVRESPVVKNGAIAVGRVMSMTISVDHRVVDGAMAANFMNKLKERLEKPQS